MGVLDVFATAWPTLGLALWTAVEGLACAVLLATLVTALAPRSWRQGELRCVFHLLDLLAGNVGHNRNRDDA